MTANRIVVLEDNFDEILNRLGGLKGAEVGYLAETTASQTYDNGLNLATNALFQEKGTKHIPPRPFMTAGADGLVAKPALVGKIIEGVVEGYIAPDTGNARIGIALKAEIQDAITTSGGVGADFAANTAATVRRKGSSRPLVDTGRLRQGVDSRGKR